MIIGCIRLPNKAEMLTIYRQPMAEVSRVLDGLEQGLRGTNCGKQLAYSERGM